MILQYALKAKFKRLTSTRSEGKKARTVHALKTDESLQGSAIN